MLRSQLCLFAFLVLALAGCCGEPCRTRCQPCCSPCARSAPCGAVTTALGILPGGQAIVVREGESGNIALANGMVIRIVEGSEGDKRGERAEHGVKPVAEKEEDDEAKVDLSSLPPAVRKAIEALVPGGEIKGIEAGSHAGKKQWEVDEMVKGREIEVVVNESGEAVKWEIQVEPSQVPPVVLKAAEDRVHGTFKTVAEVRDAEKKLTKYVVERKDGEKSFEVDVSPEGQVLKVDEDND